MSKQFDFNLVPNVPTKRAAIGIPFDDKFMAMQAWKVAETKGWCASLIDAKYNYDEESGKNYYLLRLETP